MSRTRARSPIEDVDKIALQEGLELSGEGEKRTFSAFQREYVVEEVPPGKVGIFAVSASALDETSSDYEGTLTHDGIRRLFREAVDRGNPK